MELGPKKFGFFLKPDHSINFVLGFDWNSKVRFLLAEVGSKNIGYFLEPDHWVNCLPMELGPKKIGYFLEPDHFIDYVLGFD